MVNNSPRRDEAGVQKAESTVYNDALWRKYAQVYDALLTVIPYQNLLLELVDVANIKPGMRLFDGCSGTGNLLWALEQQNVSAKVTAVDYSVAMLAKAKAKEYRGSVEFVRANLDEPVEAWGITGTFDRFIFNNCLAFLGDPVGVLTKAASLASDNALMIASTPRPNPNISELLDQHLELSQSLGISREEALQRMMPKLQPIIKANELLMAQYGDSYHMPNMQQLRSWFEDAGWHIRSIIPTYAGQNWLVQASKKSLS